MCSIDFNWEIISKDCSTIKSLESDVSPQHTPETDYQGARYPKTVGTGHYEVALFNAYWRPSKVHNRDPTYSGVALIASIRAIKHAMPKRLCHRRFVPRTLGVCIVGRPAQQWAPNQDR